MRLLIALMLAALLGGCASKQDAAELSEAEHYGKAHASLEKKSYLAAIEQLEEIQARFPYGDYAEQVQLDLTFAHYRARDYASAIAAAQRFVRSYPGHPHLDYALYMQGLANFYLQRGMLDRMVPVDQAARDLQPFKDAFRAFEELVSRFPDSEYAPDARSRMVYIRNRLAEHELHAARYYARRGAYIAAANRAGHVIRHYQGTPAVPEALAIMTRAYESLEQRQLAAKSRRVLTENWPESSYLNNGEVDLDWWPGPEDKGLLSLLTFDLL